MIELFDHLFGSCRGYLLGHRDRDLEIARWVLDGFEDGEDGGGDRVALVSHGFRGFGLGFGINQDNDIV